MNIEQLITALTEIARTRGMGYQIETSVTEVRYEGSRGELEIHGSTIRHRDLENELDQKERDNERLRERIEDLEARLHESGQQAKLAAIRELAEQIVEAAR